MQALQKGLQKYLAFSLISPKLLIYDRSYFIRLLAIPFKVLFKVMFKT